jgi:hypothetical protein
MTTWITACEQDQAPYPLQGGAGQIYIGCQSKNLRSIEMETDMPVLDPVVVTAVFSAGLVPVLTCFVVARVVGAVLKLIRHG